MDSGAQPAASTFFLATNLRPTFSPCRVCLVFGEAAVLGRPIAWSDQAACSGKPLCSPSPGGVVFRGGGLVWTQMHASASASTIPWRSMPRTGACPVWPMRLVVGFGEIFESDGGRRGWDENRGEEEHGVGRMDRRWRREDDGGRYPAPGDGGDLDRGRKLRRYRGSRRFGAGEVPYDLVGSGWREDWETGGIGGGNWLAGWCILSEPSEAEWAERSGAERSGAERSGSRKALIEHFRYSTAHRTSSAGGTDEFRWQGMMAPPASSRVAGGWTRAGREGG